MAGRRGRKPQGAYSDKTAVLTTRITRELRERLEKARKVHVRTWSLSQEVEDRLRRSFNEEKFARDIFGGPDSYAIARLIHQAIWSVQEVSHRHWADNAFTVNACVHAIAGVLGAFQLDDDADPPMHLAKYFPTPEAAGDGIALGILDQLKLARGVPVDTPKHRYSVQLKLYPMIKEDLGDLIERLK